MILFPSFRNFFPLHLSCQEHKTGQRLLTKIRESERFKQLDPDHEYNRGIPKIEKAVMETMKQSQANVHYSETVLLSYDDAYHIWPQPVQHETPARTRSHPFLPEENEERLLSLKTHGPDAEEVSSVAIIRTAKNDLRIVQQTMGSLEPDDLQLSPVFNRIGPLNFDEHFDKHRLIPRYTRPDRANTDLTMGILSAGVETPFHFATVEQLHEFQKTLMGYQVTHSQNNITFQFNKDSSFGSSKGHVQLWQQPITLSLRSEDESVLTSESTTPDTAGGFRLMRQDSLKSPIIPEDTVIDNFDCWQAEDIKSSALVIFTQELSGGRAKKRSSRFAIIYLELARGIYIDHVDCGCDNVDAEIPCPCRNISLTKRCGKTLESFEVRIGYSQTDPYGKPSISSFDLFPFRIPRHAGFDQLKKKTITHLGLTFRKAEEKEIFHNELMDRITLRDCQISKQEAFKQQLDTFERKLQLRRQMQRSGHVLPMRSLSSSSVSPLLAPAEIVLPDRGLDFADSVTKELDAYSFSFPDD